MELAPSSPAVRSSGLWLLHAVHCQTLQQRFMRKETAPPPTRILQNAFQMKMVLDTFKSEIK